ncbi:MAG TPA: hypothetical protein VFS09_01175 [Candidatus Eisenbacteria bacterium]|nr:hypothetical protein [Candidatus Eisenbacteria bacterium]
MQFRLNRVLPLLLVSSLALTSGCIFSPDKKPPTVKPPIEYLAPVSPGNVLLNLIKSYEARDSIQTGLVYDADYQGSSTDPSLPQPTVNFLREDEIHHVHRLHDDPNIVGVTLDLGPTATWVVLPPNAGDPADWVVINTNIQTVQITDNAQGTNYASSNRLIEWTFKPTTNGSTTTWTVIRWTERIN